VVGVIHGDGALPGDLLLQAVDGMDRPMFVLDEAWCFRYINPAGARVLDRTVAELVGRNVWEEFPEAVGGPFQKTYEQVRRTGQPGSTEAWSEPLATWFRADAFLTEAGVVVTYDDVTEQRRTEQERASAVASRELAAAEAARAAAAAEEAGRHLLLLGDISQAMTSTFDIDEAVQRFASLVVPLLGDWVIVTVLEHGTRRDIGRAHRDPALLPVVEHYADLRARSNRAAAPVPRLISEQRPLVVPALTPEILDAMVGDEESRATLQLLDIEGSAVAAFPMVARGELFGVVTLLNASGRGPHSDTELRTAEVACRRAALALDNARLAAASQQVAERLQRSLLSPPVQPDHLELAVRYRPATRGISIGGDWYDAFLQPDGDTVLVIGDVMGHDLEAAAAMGQVKTLVRGIAFDRGEEPAGVLRRVDHALVGLDVPTLATALVCRVEQDDEERAAGLRRLRWSSAGHPEPLLVTAAGDVEELTVPIGPPLGIGWRGPRADGTAEMPEGSTLLLFTDGLFERRGMSLDDGRRKVADVLSRRSGQPLEELCDGLLEELAGDGVEDDIAVLAVRAHPVAGQRPAEAGPELLPPSMG
jgi:serine phosphatase RsbU (regulator of sigma subunit)